MAGPPAWVEFTDGLLIGAAVAGREVVADCSTLAKVAGRGFVAFEGTATRRVGKFERINARSAAVGAAMKTGAVCARLVPRLRAASPGSTNRSSRAR